MGLAALQSLRLLCVLDAGDLRALPLLSKRSTQRKKDGVGLAVYRAGSSLQPNNQGAPR